MNGNVFLMSSFLEHSRVVNAENVIIGHNIVGQKIIKKDLAISLHFIALIFGNGNFSNFRENQKL